MYAAIASRTPEIGVLLTLGFKPWTVLVSFLAESAFIALIGGFLGCAVRAAAQWHRDQYHQLVELQ